MRKTCIRTVAIAGIALWLAACGETYQGPLRDKPVRIDDGVHTTIKTLRDRILEQDVPEEPLDVALEFFDDNLDIIDNTDWLSLIDFSAHSGQRRLYIINLKTGDVEKLHTAHGRGSDPSHTGYAREFSNEEGSNMTSVGFFLMSEAYTGKWGRAIRMDGLSESNSRARERAIVMHGADYVDSRRSLMGRSLGCPAVELGKILSVVTRLSGGSLLYAFAE